MASLTRLFSCPVPEGFIQVWESQGTRWLSLDSSNASPDEHCFQSAALIPNPERMVLPTARAMQFALGFVKPKKALLFGLGGGDVARLLNFHFPGAQIDALEHSRAVIQAFDLFFAKLMPHRSKLDIQCASAAEQLPCLPLKSYDLVFLDLFDGDSAPECMGDLDFYLDIRKVLNTEGILVANLFFEDPQVLLRTLMHIRTAFDQQSLFIPVQGHKNIVLLCFNEPLTNKTTGYLQGCFDECESRSIELDFSLADLISINEKTATGFEHLLSSI